MQDRPVRLSRLEHRVSPGGAGEVSLALHEVAPAQGESRGTPVVLLHGATFGAPMFDLALEGYSMQGFLAARGWRSFALDVRGYGRSLPCPVMDAPAQTHEPYARLEEAVDDLAAGIDFVRAHTGRGQVNLLSFSWGSVVACAYAVQSGAALERMVLYAPLYAEVNDAWIDRIADPADRNRVNPELGSYRRVDQGQLLARWDADIPSGARESDYRDAAMPGAIMKALAAADPMFRDSPELSFRAPTGALVDLFEIFSGRPLYDPSRITAPSLIIRGGDDTTSTSSDAFNLFHRLGAASKRFVTISPGSHFLCVERNAADLYAEIHLYLASRTSGPCVSIDQIAEGA